MADFFASEPVRLFQLASYIKNSGNANNSSVLARKPHLGYLAGLKTVIFPQKLSIAKLLPFFQKR